MNGFEVFFLRCDAITVVAKDIDHVDHVADEVHEEPHEPIMDHVGVDMTEGFSGGP